jgi:PIN domain nuclease of toxin-antitoxin system
VKRLLLDTHTLLWWLADDRDLSEVARDAIAAPENTVFLSAVVVWEIRIKQSLGKLRIPRAFAEVLRAEAFVELPVTVAHADALAGLALHHRDPFDRMLIAQASVETLSIVTRDTAFAPYGIDLVLA